MAYADTQPSKVSVQQMFKLLRPLQWSKNLLVFAALMFTGKYMDYALLGRSIIAFFAMCMLSSCVYVVNDLKDIDRDRRHPVKCRRPLASGTVHPREAQILGAFLALISVGLCFVLGPLSWLIIGAYLALQVAYNSGMKQLAIADVFTIALGFVLRAMLGAAAINVKISPWLVLCTGSLALMVGFAKRRHEYLIQGDQRTASRESLGSYSKAALDMLVGVAAATAAINYSIYCIESPTARKYPSLILSSLFVFYGISRYLLRVFHDNEGGEPAELLFTDRHLLCSVLLFVIAVMFAMSGFQLPLMESS